MSRSQLRLLSSIFAVAGAVIVVAALQFGSAKPDLERVELPETSLASPDELESIYNQAYLQVGRHYHDARRLATAPLTAWKDKYKGRLHTDIQMVTAVYEMLEANTDKDASFLESAQFHILATKQRQFDTKTGMQMKDHVLSTPARMPEGKPGPITGDFVLAVNGQIVDAFSDDDVTKRLNFGPPGSIVNVTVLRKEAKTEALMQHSFSVRRSIDAESKVLHLNERVIEKEDLDEETKQAMGKEHSEPAVYSLQRIELLRMNSPKLVGDLADTLVKLTKDKSEGLILDVTELNGGGPNMVASIAALFHKEDGKLFTVVEDDSPPVTHAYFIRAGKVFHSRKQGDGDPAEIIISDRVGLYDKPLVVALGMTTNGGAKMLAAVLHGRATIVGMKTDPGKYYTVAYPVGRQHYLVLPSAHYELPSGAPIDVVTPDVEIERPASDSGGEEAMMRNPTQDVVKAAGLELLNLVLSAHNDESTHH